MLDRLEQLADTRIVAGDHAIELAKLIAAALPRQRREVGPVCDTEVLEWSQEALVGPAGVFLLDSKNLHGMLAVRSGVLLVRWREDPADGYGNRDLTPRMLALGRVLETRLRVDDVNGPPVQPVVVLWGSFEQRSIASKGVAWVQGAELARVLENRPVTLSSDEIKRVAAMLRKPWRAAPEPPD